MTDATEMDYQRRRVESDDSQADRRADCYRGSWSAPGDPDGPEDAASRLAGAIDYAFNPSDGDSDQTSLLVAPVLAAMRFIEDQPCMCDELPEPEEWEPCGRCTALGRDRNQPVQR